MRLRNLAFLTSFSFLSAIGCSKASFSTSSESNGNIDTLEVIKTLQPALAVRGITCLMCHADIRANVVTDFGYGHSWYLGGEGTNFHGASWFNNYVSTWQSAQGVQGTVFVPKVPVTRSAQSVLGAGYASAPLVNLKTLMEIDYVNSSSHAPGVVDKRMSYKIQAPGGREAVSEKSSIVIRAPDESDIQRLPNSDQTGILARTGVNRATYYVNDESRTLSCSHRDIVIRGTLLLRNLHVDATQGCRIYVTGSVFIEGPVSYEGGGSAQNLQITSANGIFLGLNVTTLTTRLINDARGAQLGWSRRTYTDRAAQAVQEATNIGNLKDAVDGSTPRTSINYSGLLLNAPMVHSRYLGNVQGTIIAELALFAIGQFHFAFDSVFTQVPVLPLLKDAIVEVH